MPYVICSDCRVTTYSAALWSGADECPSCGNPLPVRRRITREAAPAVDALAPVLPLRVADAPPAAPPPL